MFTDFDQAQSAPPAAPPPGAAADWTIPQNWAHFSAEEHGVWDHLFARQQQRLAGRVVRQFADGLDLLRLDAPGIPEFGALNDRLFPRTGWNVVAVPGLVPDDIFFGHLAKRQFPAGNFIRRADQLDYLEEPDVFHDLFGHVPMLADPVMADFVHTLGEIGIAADPSALPILSRLYWHTVEFGLAREDGHLAVYGAGLASSFGEAAFALESPEPRRIPFDLAEVLATPYHSDRFQDHYCVVEDMDATLTMLMEQDLAGMIAAAAQ